MEPSYPVNFKQMKPGNKQNALLNGEWAKHVRNWGKKITSGKRRMRDQELIRELLRD
jgi:hypothetical protein